MKLGTLIHGRYHVQSLLGKGGMGAVWLAHDTQRADAPVAVKEMLASGLDDDLVDPLAERAVTQFQREAALLASLHHPNLVEVLDFFEEDDRHYLVMSYVEGRTLEQLLRDGGPAPYGEVLGWMDEVCAVLEYLHAQSPPILFRDLKPNNVMLDGDGRVKLIDFGIARAFAGDKTTTYIQGAGTVGYAPVEQFTGGTDPRSDVYALGATVYCLLTGQVPPMSIKMLNGEATRTPIHALNPLVPREVDDVVASLMALKREDRCPSVAQARRMLAAVAGRTVVPGGGAGCPRCAAALTSQARNCPDCGEVFARDDASAVTLRRGADETLPPRRPLPERTATMPPGGPGVVAADPTPRPVGGARGGLLGLVALALIVGSGVTVGTFGPATAPSAAPAATPDARGVVTDLYARYTDGLNQRVSSGITGIMTDDFKADVGPGRQVDGKTFIRNQMTELTKLADPKVTVTVEQIEARGDTLAVHVRRDMTAGYVDHAGRHAVAESTEQLDVWSRTTDGWRWRSSKRLSDQQTFDGRPTMLFPPW